MSWQQIYIDGVLHNYQPHHNDFSHDFSEIYVDSPALQFRRCARHRLSRLVIIQLSHGYVVRTGGHLYSTYPLDPDTLTPLYPHASTQPQRKPVRAHKALPNKYWAKVKELASRFWAWC